MGLSVGKVINPGTMYQDLGVCIKLDIKPNDTTDYELQTIDFGAFFLNTPERKLSLWPAEKL